jgi:hypothetical protein
MGKDKNEDLGCIGYGHGGLFKQNKIHVFHTSDNTPEKIFEDHIKYYGNTYKITFINVENPEKIYNKFVKEFEEATYENLYVGTTSGASDTLKKFSDTGKVHHWTLKTAEKKKGTNKKKDGSKKKATKKSKDDSSDESDNDKKKSSSKKSKNDSDESDSDNDKKKSVKSKKNTSDDSSSESD